VTWKKLVKLLVWLVVLGGLVAGVIIWRQWDSGDEVEAPPEVISARRSDFALKVSATGVVEPEFTVEIKPKASGVVNKVTKVEGDFVKDRELLVVIDPVLEHRKVTQAEADLAMAKAQLGSLKHKASFAQAQLTRDEALLKKGLVSADAVDTLRKELAVLQGDTQTAEAQILRARESLGEAKDRLNETKIRSPITGTVLERTVQPGQIVASGINTVGGGSTLLKIADLRRLFVRVKVDESDMAKVAPGQKARITADAHPGKVFGGKVVRIAPQGKVESNVTVFEVLVEADSEGTKALRPMMTANVDIVVAERKGVVLLPLRAVRRENPKAPPFVVVDSVGPREVKLGLADNKETEIVSGLNGDEKIQLPVPPSRKKPGAGKGSGQPTGRQMGQALGVGR
jgi:RND family efflux transporter MFP subunit